MGEIFRKGGGRAEAALRRGSCIRLSLCKYLKRMLKMCIDGFGGLKDRQVAPSEVDVEDPVAFCGGGRPPFFS
jgi:hypothetical protein